MVFIRGHHENVAGSSSERGHFGLERFQAQRPQDFDELGDEIGAVLAAQRGLEYEASVIVVTTTVVVVVTAGGQDGDLICLRRKRFGIG